MNQLLVWQRDRPMVAISALVSDAAHLSDFAGNLF
jgi:hypothetical protein